MLTGVILFYSYFIIYLFMCKYKSTCSLLSAPARSPMRRLRHTFNLTTDHYFRSGSCTLVVLFSGAVCGTGALCYHAVYHLSHHLDCSTRRAASADLFRIWCSQEGLMVLRFVGNSGCGTGFHGDRTIWEFFKIGRELAKSLDGTFIFVRSGNPSNIRAIWELSLT